MKKPVLVIMAAGLGSRYGGLKQMDPMDDQGHIIMDYSIYDAVQAGFEDVVFIIKRENEALFRECIGDRLSSRIKTQYVYQELTDLPRGYQVPEGRVKPWGTGHAILSCRKALEETPFAVINADDYYGREAFRLIYQYLASHQDDERYRYAMVGYAIGNTVTEHGSVARGVCRIDDQGHLTNIRERTRIEKRGTGIAYTEDEGASWIGLPEDTTVSMNLWGFSPAMLRELKERFPAFLENNLGQNPLKCEYFLPSVVEDQLKEDKALVEVLKTPDRWYGVTYREDKPLVMAALKDMRESGIYPEKLWD